MSLATPRKGYKSVPWLFGKEIEISEEWDFKTLKTFVTIQSGEYFQFNEFSEKGVPVLKIDNVMHGKVEWETKTFLDKKYLNSHKEIVLNQGDIVLALNRPITHNQVKVAQLTIKDSPSILYQRVGRFLFKNKYINKDFFYVFLSSPFFKKLLSGILVGSDQPYVRTTELLIKHIPIPPLLEQQKIASILSNVDHLIESTEQVITHSKKVKTGLMQKLLTRGIGHTKFKKVPWLFGKETEIPEEWEWQQISDNSTLKGRIGWQGLTTKEYRQEGQFYLVTGTDFKNGKIDWENCVYVDEDRYVQDTNIQLKENDVLITKDGTIGKIAYVYSIPIPSTLNTGVFVVRPIDERYVPLFFYYVLFSDYFIKFLNKLKAGSTINHLYQKDFNTFHFPIPSLSEQQKIATILSNIDSKITSQEQCKEKLQKLKKSLMQKLLTGEIRVKL